MFKKVTIITNPIAGSGRAMKFPEYLKAELARHDVETDLKLTTQTGDACEIARQHSQDSPIVCLGGDGTVNEIINGLLGNKHFTQTNRPPLGIIPFGSGNVIAKELFLKRSIKHFIYLYQNNLLRYLDVGCVHLPAEASAQAGLLEENKKRYFISMAGVGFDAEVARQYHFSRKGSKLQAHLFNYLPIALKTIPRYRMPRITIQIDDKIVSSDATFVQVANVRSYGGPFVLVNNAVFDDGFLDVLWFKGKSPANIILYYTLAFLAHISRLRRICRRHRVARKDCIRPSALPVRARTQTGLARERKASVAAALERLSPSVAKRRRAKKIILSSAQKVPIQVDGDWCGYLPVQIEIIPKGIQVYTSI